MARSSSTAVPYPAWCTLAAAGMVVFGLMALRTAQTGLTWTPWNDPTKDDEDDDDMHDIPEAYRDPISLGVIQDPVLLNGTGHVYDYQTLRAWFSTGNRTCPKSNIELFDIQITRLPCLRQEIAEWSKKQGRRMPAQVSNMEEIAELDPVIPHIINKLRGTSGTEREGAIVTLHGALTKIQEKKAKDPVSARLHTLLAEELMEELIWHLRYAEPKVQGVAAHILLWFDSSEELAWLSACAIVPVVSLCWSPDMTYTSQMAIRLLYNMLVPGGDTARQMAKRLGIVECLTRILAVPRDKCTASRDRVIETLRLLAEQNPATQEYLKENAMESLLAMASQDINRWERRDASTLLLKLGVPQNGMARKRLTIHDLCLFSWCSDAWLLQEVHKPNEKYTAEESVKARVVARFADKTDTELAHLAKNDMLKNLAIGTNAAAQQNEEAETQRAERAAAEAEARAVFGARREQDQRPEREARVNPTRRAWFR